MRTLLSFAATARMAASTDLAGFGVSPFTRLRALTKGIPNSTPDQQDVSIRD